jgi:hypothetical protein
MRYLLMFDNISDPDMHGGDFFVRKIFELKAANDAEAKEKANTIVKRHRWYNFRGMVKKIRLLKIQRDVSFD